MRPTVSISILMFCSILAASAAAAPWVGSLESPLYFAVDVADVDVAIAWYEQVFHVPEKDDNAAEDGRWRIANLRGPDVAIEIIFDRRSSSSEDRHHGLAKVGASVPDLEGVADRVETATGERPRILDFEAHGIRLMQLRDPEGNVIQLHEPLALPDTDASILLGMHETVLRSHRENDLDAWMETEASEYVNANGGEITHPSPEERRSRREPYLARTRFSRYEDVVEPIVRVSDDGTLGWVICQVRIEGEREGTDGSADALASEWAWIELYQKIEGRWRQVGNVSNRKR